MTIRNAIAARLIKAARARGYEITPLWRLASRPLISHLRSLIEKYRVDCVIDVGANRGQFYDLLRSEVAYRGLVISFEPVARYATALEVRASSESKWKIFNCALGSSDGTATINITQSPGLNSFLEPRTDVLKEFWGVTPIVETQTVEVRRFDGMYADLQSQFGFRSPYLKIDTQGFDLEVMKGAGNAMNDVCALQTEASVKPIYVGMPTYMEVIEYLSLRGFDLSAMFPVSLDNALRLVEFDCIMTNRRVADTI